MAGHSEWQNRKYRKRRQDRKKAKLFGKYSRKIISAARRGGGDPEKNTELKRLIERAQDDDMPKENIERAIKKGTGDLPGVEYEDHVYEGYGPGGIAVMVDVTTDNKNRSIAEIRKIFDDHGGNVGERGCVSYQFEQVGYMVVPGDELEEDQGETELFDRAVEAGARDIQRQGDDFEITTSVGAFVDVKSTLEEAGYPIERAELTRIPKTTVPVSGDEGERVLELLEELDDHKDVQDVHSNFEMASEEFEAVQVGAAG